MKLTPIGSRIVVEPIAAATRETASGIIIESKAETFKRGTVTAAPKDSEISVGQTVLYARGTEVETQGETFTLVEMDSVVAVID